MAEVVGVVIEDLCTSVFQTYQRPSAHSVGQRRCSDADIPPQVVTNQKGGFATVRFWATRRGSRHLARVIEAQEEAEEAHGFERRRGRFNPRSRPADPRALWVHSTGGNGTLRARQNQGAKSHPTVTRPRASLFIVLDRPIWLTSRSSRQPVGHPRGRAEC
jgi:hypothetical protein